MFANRLSAEPFEPSLPVQQIAAAVHAAGGRAVVVGGAVRDHLLGLSAKDADLEIYGLQLATLETILMPVGHVHAVGRSFGVLKVDVDGRGGSEAVDVALPRRESKSGRGHRGFVVEGDPHMAFADAARRRDFTINAMGWDLSDGRLLDPHSGRAHLEAGLLQHVSEAFAEDPLRVLRGAQLAARFGLSMSDATVSLCQQLRPELDALPHERIYEELKKLLLRAPWPSVGLKLLQRTRALELFDELCALVGCPQEAEWHPEGDVWTHTLMVTDEAARLAAEEELDDTERMVLVLAALCHDLGKPATTSFERGRVRSPDHESAGEAPTRSFLTRIGAPHAIIDAVVPLVREHLKPFQLYRDRKNVSDGALRRLAVRAPIDRLVRVARADHFGRTTEDALTRHDEAGAWLVAQAERLLIEDAKPTPILLGRHVLAAGLEPGPHIGVLLRESFEAQLDGVFDDEAGALSWLSERLATDAPPESS